MGRSVEFVTWDGGGNVNVALGLTERLAAAGWDVGVYGPPSVGDRVQHAGARFTPRDVPDPWDVAAMALDVRSHCGHVEPDAVVVDYMLPGALCGAEACGRPTAALVHTLYGALLDGGAPSPMGMAASPAAVDEARAAVGLGPVAGLGGLLEGCRRVFVTCPAALDVSPGGAGLPGNVRYVGAALEGAGPDAGWQPPTVSPATGATPALADTRPDEGVDPADADAEADTTTGAPAGGTDTGALAGGRAGDAGPGDRLPGDGEAPLVVVTLGTTPMDEASVLQSVLDALAEAPVRVLAMLGPHLAAGDVVAPPNATVTGYVRHAAVLPHASALVTHAGLGTVLAGLAHGVPLVCVPLGREQPDNAAAVTRLGAGVTVPPPAVRSSLGRAVLDALVDPDYRTAAQAMATTISDVPTDAVERELTALTAG